MLNLITAKIILCLLPLFTTPTLVTLCATCAYSREKAMASHSSTLAWRIPGTGEPGGLPSLGSHRVGHDWSDLAAAVLIHWVMPDSLRPHGLQPARLLCPWGFSRQEYWSGLPCPPPGNLPNSGIEPRSPALQGDSLPTEPPGKHRTTLQGALVKDHPEVKFFNADISRILRKLVCFVLWGPF